MRQLQWMWALIGCFVLVAVARGQTYYCDSDNECTNKACCGYSEGQGICGFGDDFCGDTCISNCNATAECGKYASPAGKECPLNVCCSQYGFCGTTDDFCGSGCQGANCGYPAEPSCSSNDAYKRVIGYYESWASSRSCDSWSPSSLAVNGLTHLNYAFATFYETEDHYYMFAFMDGAEEPAVLVKEFMELKENNPGLSLYLSIGGWSFNDGDTASYWSDMASTSTGRYRFAQALLQFLDTYGFDGVDLDWEYPVADDRGGKAEDKDNYVALIKEIRFYFDLSGNQYGLTFTTPASYWYLQNFDVPGMLEAGADWTNIMTYDLHGVWDGDDPWIGKVVGAHTNLTEIKSALDLMWRAGVDPSRVVLGVGFYGRSFTLKDPSCYEPGCPFSTGGNEGPCTKTSGVLSYNEITEYLAEDSATLYTDNTAAVNYMVWDSGQWVSFDTKATFQQKVDYANNVCLGGLMIWSLDQDTYDWQALTGLLGQDQNSNNLLKGGSMSNADAEDLARVYSAYTGGSCYITECMDWNTGQCKDDYSVLDYVHSGVLGLIENPDDHLCKRGHSIEEDEDSQYRLICCQTDTMPEGCSWEGANENGICGNRNGEAPCGDNKYELVGDLFNDRTGASRCLTGKRSLCCNASPALSKCEWTQCTQGCTSDDDWAPPFQTTYEGTNLDQEPETCLAGFSIFCCPSEDTYKGCDWNKCTNSCPSDKVLITQRTYIFDIQVGNVSDCSTGTNMYCCDPPEVAENLPVDPAYLFKYPDEDDVSYYYQVEDSANTGAGDDADTDPFAFVMIDGDPSAYDESLVDQWSFLTDEDELTKRDLKVHKRNSIYETREDTFDNVEEVYHIRCSAMAFSNSTACLSIFQGGAANTIVKMPKDIGAGPYARVVRLVPLGTTKRDIHPRASTDTYELTVDYDFEAASASEEEKGDVNFRVDYTNLLEYWNDVTDEPASKRKRWFGSFSNWLEKVTTIVKDEKGHLPLDYTDTVKLFHAETYCPKLDVEATFDIDADLRLFLNAQYAYYFEGSILPTPSLISSYAYFSIQPEAVILLTLRAEATVQVNPDPVYIVNGLTFPGLSVKGLISIGPQLNLIGEMDASMRVSGELNAGVALTWPRAEVYFPQNDDGEDATVGPKDLQDGDNQVFSVDPTFDASLSAEGNMDLSITPEARFGISVLGGTLMSGYVTAGLKNTVSVGFNATVSYDGSTSAGFCYWADFLYSLYLRADVSFLNDMAYWGDQYNAASPDKPLTLVEDTCITYSNKVELSKRGTTDALVANSTDAGCFGGLISCSTTLGGTSNGTCINYSQPDDTDEASVTKRANCNHVPAMFYNCNGDFFKRIKVMNENQNTNYLSDSITLKSICDNILDYIQKGVASQGTNFPGDITDPTTGESYMILNYISSYENGGANRDDACGGTGGGSDQCSALKESLWPTQVSAMKALGKQATQNYKKMLGYTYSMSCDEFPFNSAEEGGYGANTECVGKAQQDYQRQVNNILTRIKDINSGREWSEVGGRFPTTWGGGPRTYTMNLVYNANGRPLAGGGDFSMTNVIPWDRVIGGVNLFENPYLSLAGTNAVCAIDGYNEVWDDEDRIMKYYFAGCTVTFVSSTVPYKRGYQWEVDEVRLPDNWRETVKAVPADEVEDFIEHRIAEVLGVDEQPTPTSPNLASSAAQYSEETAGKSQHLNYHRHHASHHGH